MIVLPLLYIGLFLNCCLIYSCHLSDQLLCENLDTYGWDTFQFKPSQFNAWNKIRFKFFGSDKYTHSFLDVILNIIVCGKTVTVS